MAQKNEQFIKELAGNPPKNTDPPTARISTRQVGTGLVQVQDFVITKGKESLVAGAVQSELNDIMDIKLDVDGDYGSSTKGAITEFQEASKLLVNGELDKKTFYKLESIYEQYRFYSEKLYNSIGLEQINYYYKKLNDLVAPYRKNKGTGNAYVTADQLKQLGWKNVNDEMVRSLNDTLVKLI